MANGDGAGRIFVVVPCMGRLEFLRRSAPRITANPLVRYCLVDFSCPDRCGEWLRHEFPDAAKRGQVVVEHVPGRTLFNKCAAHNAGGRRALQEGAEYLCFLDADTLVADGFLPWLVENVQRDRFLIAARRADGSDRHSLTGLIVLHADAFAQAGGFDETFTGWGGEDIEFRIRLALLHGLGYADVPEELVEPIPHGDDLRTRFYRQKNASVSNSCNMRKLKYRIRHVWKGRWCVDPSTLDRLWYRPWPSQGQ
jgi:GT2 family glycosyltransferase